VFKQMKVPITVRVKDSTGITYLKIRLQRRSKRGLHYLRVVLVPNGRSAGENLELRNEIKSGRVHVRRRLVTDDIVASIVIPGGNVVTN